ncbi:TPA: hypothetical protein ACH3X3_014968 [Trebouxia sp. C0006]
MDYCATQATASAACVESAAADQAADESADAAAESAEQDEPDAEQPGAEADDAAAEEVASAEADDAAISEGAESAEAEVGLTADAAAEQVASAGTDTQQAELSRTLSTSTRLAALEQENSDMKAQIASLNARLAQHAQHAEHLLAGTEAFFGPKAGTIIGQALEEEDSDLNLSFTSAQERSFSRPMSAGSSYSSALSTSGRSRSVSPALHAQGLSRGAGSSKTLGPGDSGVSSASFETAREDALSRMGSAATQEDLPAEAAHGHSKRKALKNFLHKLRHGAESDSIPSPPSRQGTSPAKPSLGTAADRAAAHQFARSLSQKGPVSGLPDRQAMPSVPQTPFARASAWGSPERPQQEAPPSMRVRSLSRQFSERAQQLQTTRSVSQSRQTAPAAASIAEDEEQPEPATAFTSSSTAGTTSGAAEDQQPPDAVAESSASAKSESTGMMNAKQQALNRSLSSATAAFAFGSGSTVSAPKLLRSVTGVSPAAKPFAFGSTAAPVLATSGTAQLLGAGQAAAAAASVGFAAGQLFGFAAPATARSVPSFGTGAFGELGSGFSFGSGTRPAPPSLQAAGQAVAAAAAVAAVKDAEQDPEDDAASTHEVDSVEGTNEEGAGEEAEDSDIAEADKADDKDGHEDADKADEDDSHFALPDDLLSDDDKEAPAEASIAGSANVINAEVDTTHKDDGSANGDEEEESEAAADSDAELHVSEDEAGMRTAHAGRSQDGSVYEDGTEGSKSHDADADDGSEYQDGSEGEEEQYSHSGDDDKASADEVLDEVVDDLAEDEGSYEGSLEDVGGSDNESID